MKTIRTTPLAAALIAAVAALALGACSRPSDPTVGEKLDTAIQKGEQKAAEAKQEMKKDVANAQDATQRTADDMAQKVEGAADKVGTAITDAGVTAGINAELARDPSRSALKINVDTANGQVTLSGKAPDAASRDRATTLAQGVKGVSKVENRLQIGN